MVRDIMTRQAILARPEDSLLHVAEQILSMGQSTVPVVDASNRLVGIITDLDILHRALPRYLDMLEDVSFLPPDFEGLDLAEACNLAEVAVREVMRTENLHTVEEDAPLAEAALLMLRHRVRTLPVVRDGVVVGLVSRRELLHRIIQTCCEPS
ncbi:MAG: CBS domain-containing protein [Armatimonadetes bacterium]|nr:CBS domain-containing protein [Armatimonadota bacterium]